MNNRQIGIKMAQLRKERGLSTVELGRRIGLSQPQISRLENGHQGFRSETLTRIAEALDVPPAYFFDEEAEEVHQVKITQKEARQETGQALMDELRAQYGELSATPGWRQLIRRLAAALSKGTHDARILRRLIDKLLTMNNDERSRLLKRLTGR